MKSRAAGVVLFRRSPGDGPIRYLLLRNALHRVWGLPKGHIEPGEDDRAAMLRELFEETGISGVSLIPGFLETLRYPVTDANGRRIDKTVAYFLGESPSEDVRLSDEHDRHLWGPLDEVLRLVAFDNMRRLLRLAHDRLDAGQSTG